jgi:hypothetical protein
LHGSAGREHAHTKELSPMKSGVEHLANHPGWKSKAKKSPSAARKKSTNTAAVNLTAEDWAEIYYALDYKLQFSPAVQGGDREAQRWRAHLRRIIKAIGPDGKLAAESSYFDESELATVLAALRLFQREHESLDSVQIADAWPMHFNVQGDGKDVTIVPEPLGSEAIDALCERINCGG